MVYVYRNNTVERFFPSDWRYSGYSDVSEVPDSAEQFVWWYHAPMSGDSGAVAKEIESYKLMFSMVIERIGNRQIILLTMASIFNDWCTSRSSEVVESAIADYNGFLYLCEKENQNIKVVDIQKFYCNYHREDLIDWKYYFLSQMLPNPRLASDFKLWWETEMRSITMIRKKCLILDLDNTLWGGVLGEDGVAGIQISGDYPGKAFQFWQKGLKRLKESGVILCICSKNNEADVLEVWDKREDMILQKEDFAAWRINWLSKYTNIEEMANELNVGLESMVFVDDNPTERDLVRKALPAVSVPDWISYPYELPILYKQIVETYFRVYDLTEEDKNKTIQYQQNTLRKKTESMYASMDEFLASLELKLKVERLSLENDAKIIRAAQMTQKTNQFNLTTRRYEESDIRKFIKNGMVWSLSVTDKFGEYGIVGLLIFDSSFKIDTMLLSCRVLGKGIESAFVKYVLQKIRIIQEGLIVTAEYIPTAKNVQVKDFWDKVGFHPVYGKNGMNESVDDSKRHYSLCLDNADLTIKEYYKIEE